MLGDRLPKCPSALYALPGSDTTSKITTKFATVNAVRKPVNVFSHPEFQLFTSNRKMNTDGSDILGEVFEPPTDVETFDDLLFAAFDSNAFRIDFERTPLQLMQGNVSKETTTNNRCEFKPHLDMPL